MQASHVYLVSCGLTLLDPRSAVSKIVDHKILLLMNGFLVEINLN